MSKNYEKYKKIYKTCLGQYFNISYIYIYIYTYIYSIVIVYIHIYIV